LRVRPLAARYSICRSSIKGDEYEVQLGRIVGGDVLFSCSLNRFGGTRTDGKRTVNWLCSTLGLVRATADEGRA
jgi:hypothetical protein